MSFDDFMAYCDNLTDQQLEAVLEKEWIASRVDSSRLEDYHAAVAAAQARGWFVHNGACRA